MIVKTKEKEKIYFKDVKVGQVFRECGEETIYMKVDFENDYICCPRCEEDINIYDQTGDCWAVELSKGSIYEFNVDDCVEPIQGCFIKE